MYFTKERVDVTKRIKEGRTFLIHGKDIEAEQEAEKIAKRQCSYYYDVYSDCEVTKKRIQVGFGIPK